MRAQSTFSDYDAILETFYGRAKIYYYILNFNKKHSLKITFKAYFVV